MTKYTANQRRGAVCRADGAYISRVEGGTFYKSIAGSSHLLHTPRALAFNIASLEDAERLSAQRVEVADRESRRVWRATIAQIRRYGFEVKHGGFEAQIAVPLSRWPKGGGDLCEDTPPTAQLELFAGLA
jgi:hypothetical protein